MTEARTKFRPSRIGPMLPPLPVVKDVDSATLRRLVAEKVDTLRQPFQEDGVLLIRGAGLSVDDFRHFVRTFSGREPFSYAGGVSPRSPLGSGVYTSTEYPPDIELALHNELSYSPVFP